MYSTDEIYKILFYDISVVKKILRAKELMNIDRSRFASSIQL